MATNIKERAKNLHDWILRRDGRLKYVKLKSLLERELAEQDAISRQDERERCIITAIEWLKENRWDYDQTSDNQFDDMLKELRKAMEKGGNR